MNTYISNDETETKIMGQSLYKVDICENVEQRRVSTSYQKTFPFGIITIQYFIIDYIVSSTLSTKKHFFKYCRNLLFILEER